MANQAPAKKHPFHTTPNQTPVPNLAAQKPHSAPVQPEGKTYSDHVTETLDAMSDDEQKVWKKKSAEAVKARNDKRKALLPAVGALVAITTGAKKNLVGVRARVITVERTRLFAQTLDVSGNPVANGVVYLNVNHVEPVSG